MKKNSNKNGVVILGGGINALAIIRSFEKTDIPVLTMSWYKECGMVSRYTKSMICPNPLNKDELIQFLIELGKKTKNKSVLFATSDLFMLPIIEYKDKLKSHFLIPVCDWNILSNLLKKEYLYTLAEKINIPAPKYAIANNITELESVSRNFELPIIIKPSVNVNFASHFGEKALLIRTQETLFSFIKKAHSFNFDNEPLILQEYILGDVTDLYTIVNYANKDSEIKGFSIEHKIRQFPPETGTIVSGKVTYQEEVYLIAKEFIKAAQFYGISDIEFKREQKTGKFKLIEINPRTGLSNLGGLACGVNLPLMAYNDILGFPIKEEFNKDREISWLITPLDLYYVLLGNKRKGYPQYTLSLKQWYKSIKGKKVDATFKLTDPMPFIKGLLMKYK